MCDEIHDAGRRLLIYTHSHRFIDLFIFYLRDETNDAGPMAEAGLLTWVQGTDPFTVARLFVKFEDLNASVLFPTYSMVVSRNNAVRSDALVLYVTFRRHDSWHIGDMTHGI